MKSKELSELRREFLTKEFDDYQSKIDWFVSKGLSVRAATDNVVKCIRMNRILPKLLTKAAINNELHDIVQRSGDESLERDRLKLQALKEVSSLNSIKDGPLSDPEEGEKLFILQVGLLNEGDSIDSDPTMSIINTMDGNLEAITIHHKPKDSYSKNEYYAPFNKNNQYKLFKIPASNIVVQ